MFRQSEAHFLDPFDGMSFAKSFERWVANDPEVIRKYNVANMALSRERDLESFVQIYPDGRWPLQIEDIEGCVSKLCGEIASRLEGLWICRTPERAKRYLDDVERLYLYIVFRNRGKMTAYDGRDSAAFFKWKNRRQDFEGWFATRPVARARSEQ